MAKPTLSERKQPPVLVTANYIVALEDGEGGMQEFWGSWVAVLESS